VNNSHLFHQALQLLEFLVKNGSERVVDDARSHLSLLRMLRQFHYIDPNGKDQGINVRNRSAELTKLLGDVEAIRSERKKARANKNKYGGVEGGPGLGGGFSGSSGRYGGFGSETGGFGGYSGEVYGDGGGFGGRETDFSGTQRRADQFEEYDEDEEGGSSRPAPTRATQAPPAAKKVAPKPKEPEQDLFEFGDDEPPTTGNGKAPAAVLSTAADDDDFDDFQEAPTPSTAAPPASASAQLAALSPPPATSTTTSATQFAAPRPVAPGQSAGFNNIFNTPSPAPPLSATPSVSSIASPPLMAAQTSQQPKPAKPSGPNYFTTVNTSMNTTQVPSSTSAFSARPTGTTTSQSSFSSAKSQPTSMANLGKPATKSNMGGNVGGDAFANIWSNAGSKAGVQSKQVSKGPDLASMAKEKSSAGLWGSATSTSSTPKPAQTNQGASKPLGNGLDDLLG
jgi:epsin